MELEFKNIKYKGMFNDLTLGIKENSITAIIGKNNCGKTSLFNLIYGEEENYSGAIKLGRRIISSISKKNSILEYRKKVFYIKQEFEDQLFNINILEDIKYGLSKINEKELYELLQTFDLDEHILDKCYSELNSCEQKKLLIIKMLLADAKVIMIDDVTKDLDLKCISTLIKILKREKRKGKIIIISSLDSDFLLKTADNFLVIKDSNVLSYSDKYELLSDKKLLKELSLSVPKILNFKLILKQEKINLMNRDSIDDLIKDIYRNAK